MSYSRNLGETILKRVINFRIALYKGHKYSKHIHDQFPDHESETENFWIYPLAYKREEALAQMCANALERPIHPSYEALKRLKQAQKVVDIIYNEGVDVYKQDAYYHNAYAELAKAKKAYEASRKKRLVRDENLKWVVK